MTAKRRSDYIDLLRLAATTYRSIRQNRGTHLQAKSAAQDTLRPILKSDEYTLIIDVDSMIREAEARAPEWFWRNVVLTRDDRRLIAERERRNKNALERSMRQDKISASGNWKTVSVPPTADQMELAQSLSSCFGYTIPRGALGSKSEMSKWLQKKIAKNGYPPKKRPGNKI